MSNPTMPVFAELWPAMRHDHNCAAGQPTAREILMGVGDTVASVIMLTQFECARPPC